MPGPPQRRTLMHNLGTFFGHIIKGARTDPDKSRRVVRHDVQEEIRDTPEGKMTLRRTTIEEVELLKRPPRAGGGGGGDGAEP